MRFCLISLFKTTKIVRRFFSMFIPVNFRTQNDTLCYVIINSTKLMLTVIVFLNDGVFSIA